MIRACDRIWNVALGPQRRRRGVGNRWNDKFLIACRTGPEGGLSPIGDQKAVSHEPHRGAVVEAAPSAVFEMSEPDLLLDYACWGAYTYE
jgi:hypothetical protein